MVEISNDGVTAKINELNAQLYSLARGKTEVMWPGGAPSEDPRRANLPRGSWPNSSLIVLPIFGPAINNTIYVRGKPYSMGQHGLSRALPWTVSSSTSSSATFAQEYSAGTKVVVKDVNSAFPNSFSTRVTYSIDSKGGLVFDLGVQNKSELPMPFAAGFLPAFARKPDDKVEVNLQGIDSVYLDDMSRSTHSNMRVLERINLVTYTTRAYDLRFSHTFGNTALWAQENWLVAIAPVTAPPLSDRKDLIGRPGYMSIRKGEVARFRASISLILREDHA